MFHVKTWVHNPGLNVRPYNMHSLTAFLEREAAGSDTMVLEVNDTASERDDCICVNLSHLKQLDRCLEFGENAKKRMGVKITGMLRLPYACLVCPEYNVNHESLKSFGYDEVGKAWEFIETISVASTEATRSLVRRLRRGRTLEGYRLRMGMMETRYDTQPPDDVSSEIRSLGTLRMHQVSGVDSLMHSSTGILTTGNSLALRSCLTLGLPPPPPLYRIVDALQEETETLYSENPSSMYSEQT